MPDTLSILLQLLPKSAGCFAFWSWLRLGKSTLWSFPAWLRLRFFAWLLTMVDAAAAGRTYAAYGGVYIVASLLALACQGVRRITGT